MNMKALVSRYLGWCPGAESAARFIPDRELSDRVVLMRMTGGILGFMLLGALLSGVPVPTRPPFINLIIKIDQEICQEDNTVNIEFRIVNQMPFKIKLEPFNYYERSIFRYGEGNFVLVSSSLDDVPPKQGESGVVIWPFASTNMGGYLSLPSLTKGEYLVYFNIDNCHISKNFKVK